MPGSDAGGAAQNRPRRHVAVHASVVPRRIHRAEGEGVGGPHPLSGEQGHHLALGGLVALGQDRAAGDADAHAQRAHGDRPQRLAGLPGRRRHQEAEEGGVGDGLLDDQLRASLRRGVDAIATVHQRQGVQLGLGAAGHLGVGVVADDLQEDQLGLIPGLVDHQLQARLVQRAGLQVVERLVGDGLGAWGVRGECRADPHQKQQKQRHVPLGPGPPTVPPAEGDLRARWCPSP